MSDKIPQDKVKLNLARIKKFGLVFEININPDAAVGYKNGKVSDIKDVLLAEGIFTDAKKGLAASDDELQKAFHTTDFLRIADIIIKEGEIQVTAEYRAAERERKLRKLVDMIHRQAVDSKTGLPHPPARIEAALEQAKVHLDDHKTAEEQFSDVVARLRPVIPISIEKAKLTFTIPAVHAGKAYNLVSSNSRIITDSWNSDGSWTVTAELPAGLKLDFIDKLNSLTHGEVLMRN